MSDPIPSLFDALAAQAAAALEGMTGERPEIAVRPAAAPPEGTALLRRQTFAGVPGALWIAATEADASAAGSLVLEAAGLTETDPEKVRAEFLELLGQAVSGVARDLSDRLGREVRPESAEDAAALPKEAAWASIELNHGATTVTLMSGLEPALSAALVVGAPPGEIEKLEERKTPTFNLLLDVQLPINVSFGRTQVPLKDVLKLTTGSIVELNRTIGDPVEVIVNDCVIARGEVVTVEGNFGVRIQEVVSRHERWKTLG